MEGEDKTKKVAKEKRSVKKTKAAALPIKEIPAVTEPKKRLRRRSAPRPRNVQFAPSEQRSPATSRFSSARTLLASDARAWESGVMRPLTGYRPSTN